jgi:hypothetical protein
MNLRSDSRQSYQKVYSFYGNSQFHRVIGLRNEQQSVGTRVPKTSLLVTEDKAAKSGLSHFLLLCIVSISSFYRVFLAIALLWSSFYYEEVNSMLPSNSPLTTRIDGPAPTDSGIFRRFLRIERVDTGDHTPPREDESLLQVVLWILVTRSFHVGMTKFLNPLQIEESLLLADPGQRISGSFVRFPKKLPLGRHQSSVYLNYLGWRYEMNLVKVSPRNQSSVHEKQRCFQWLKIQSVARN